MLTKEQALTSDRFHANGCSARRVECWRRNGQTKTWKTRPDEWRVPVKYGLYNYGYIDQHEARHFHVPADCPIDGAQWR